MVGMNNIDCILWIVLFPISTDICELIAAKRRKVTGEEGLTKSQKETLSWAFFIIWVGGALVFYN